jgi:hypothetical protein
MKLTRTALSSRNESVFSLSSSRETPIKAKNINPFLHPPASLSQHRHDYSIRIKNPDEHRCVPTYKRFERMLLADLASFTGNYGSLTSSRTMCFLTVDTFLYLYSMAQPVNKRHPRARRALLPGGFQVTASSTPFWREMLWPRRR